MRMLGFKKNNKGFSLVELLVAMAIFAAAIVPMLYAFVYSTGYNFRSQQTLQATGISQAIIENCKAANTNYDSIVTDLASGDILKENNSFSSFTVSDLGGGVFFYEGVRAANFDRSDVDDAVDSGNTSRRAYDVRISLTALSDSVTDFSMIHTMRSGITANYTLVDVLKAQDEAAQGVIFQRLKDEIKAGTSCAETGLTSAQVEAAAESLFINNLDIKNIYIERRITITSDDSGVVVKAEYYYDGYGDDATHPITYSNSGSQNLSGTTYHFSVNASVPADPDPTDASGNYEYEALSGAHASSVYFYYYPCYKATNGIDGTAGTSDDTANFTDHFVLVNNMSSAYLINGTDDSNRLDFYLFKQNDIDNDRYSDDKIEDYEQDYECVVDMTNNATFPVNLYHNFLWNVANEEDLPEAAWATVNDGGNTYNRTRVVHADPNNLSDRSILNPLVTANYKDTFYNDETGGDRNSLILEDQAVFPYWSEKYDGVSSVTFYGARYGILIEVFPHGSTNEVEHMYSEFLNW